MDSSQALAQAGHLNWIDYSIVVFIALSVLISLIRGFTREVISLVTWVAAFLLAFNFATDVASFFDGKVSSGTIRFALGFGIIFIVSLILGAIVNYLISTLVDKTGLSGTDRVLGIGLGAARGVLVVAMVIVVAGFTSIPKEPAWEGSVLLPHFEDCANWLKQFVPTALNYVQGDG
jgi:membrane protein required for colicin V production